MQAVVVEFPERQGQPLFGVEHLIEGDYVKYNSNSGYVAAGAVAAAAAVAAAPGAEGPAAAAAGAAAEGAAARSGGGAAPGESGLAAAAELLRNTPQAFSHFTFVHTKVRPW